MKISSKTVEYLAELICAGPPSYRSGPELVRLFNKHGFNDTYGQGFPSRITYARSHIEELNDSKELKIFVEDVLNPINFINQDAELQSAIETMNKYLAFDGYAVASQGRRSVVTGLDTPTVEIETEVLSDDFIQEQIAKCRQKINSGDYDGAITNSRSLVEAVIRQIGLHLTGQEIKKSGDLKQDYKKVRDLLNLSPDSHSDEHIRQVLNGFTSVIDGIESLGNRMGDRHRRNLRPDKRHAKLVVNAAMTISDFLLETYEKHSIKKKEAAE